MSRSLRVMCANCAQALRRMSASRVQACAECLHMSTVGTIWFSSFFNSAKLKNGMGLGPKTARFLISGN